MQLLDLPREGVDEILKQAILARGLKRGLRLRLVNKFLATAVIDALYTFHLLDVLDVSEGKGNKKLMLPYLMHRLSAQKSIAHIPYLNSIPCAANEIYVANHGTEDFPSSAVEPYIRTLCTAALNWPNPGCNNCVNFYAVYHRRTKLTDTEYQMFLFAAAIITNALPIIERAMEKDYVVQSLDAPETYFRPGHQVFGEYIRLAATYGNENTVQYLLSMGASSGEIMIERRTKLFKRAAEAGRADLVRFIYAFQANDDELPWNTEIGHKAIQASVNTPNPEVFDFVMELHDAHGVEIQDSLSGWLEDHCWHGNVDIVKRLLGLRPKLPLWRGSGKWYDSIGILLRAMMDACFRGHKGAIDCLVAHGANPSEQGSAVSAAIEGGHLELARELVTMGYPPYGPFHMILDAGARPLVYDSSAPLLGAIKREDKSLFKLLLEGGARLRGREDEMCYEVAKREGLESMMELLEQHGLDMEKCEAAYRKWSWNRGK